MGLLVKLIGIFYEFYFFINVPKPPLVLWKLKLTRQILNFTLYFLYSFHNTHFIFTKSTIYLALAALSYGENKMKSLLALILFTLLGGFIGYRIAKYIFTSSEVGDSVNLLDLNPNDAIKAKSIFDFFAKDIDGKTVDLMKYKGHVMFIVNVATYWGLTAKNYAQLADLHSRYAKQGLRILAFPSNQFANQEPGTNAEIKKFAISKGAQFDLFSKIDVNGVNAHPLYVYLKSRQGGTFGDGIKWNFSKFLVNKYGVPVKRYSPYDEPLSAEESIKEELKKEFRE